MSTLIGSTVDLQALTDKIRQWGAELGFQQIGFTNTNLDLAEQRLQEWIDKQYHGNMEWFETRGLMRSRPELLEPGTVCVISARMDYLPEDISTAVKVLNTPEQAYVSRYALGRDYHKMMRKRLSKLAALIQEEVKNSNLARTFVDSAPVLEKPLAQKAGLGWQGKHTILINKSAGSQFFLGEIYTDIPFPDDKPATNHCGSCSACIDICPTKAIVAPYVLDATRCITYQTVENKGSVPLELRPLMGNRVFGCDDCQLFCPWNKFAQHTHEEDFKARHNLDQSSLVELFMWSEDEFLTRTAGSAIRRTGYQSWLRNLAIGIGNGPSTAEAINALKQRLGFSLLVDEHIQWALIQLQNK